MPRNNKVLIQLLFGAIFVVVAFILSFLMVIKVIESTLILSLLSYALSIAGLGLGLAATYEFIPKDVKEKIKRRRGALRSS